MKVQTLFKSCILFLLILRISEISCISVPGMGAIKVAKNVAKAIIKETANQGKNFLKKGGPYYLI